LLLLSITVLLVRMVFIRTKSTVGARTAQIRSWHATAFETLYIKLKSPSLSWFDQNQCKP